MRPIPTSAIVALAIVIVVGVQRLYPRTVRPERMIVFPLLLVLFGANSLYALFPGADPAYAAAAVLACGVGMLLGWVHAARWQVHFDAAKRLVRVPGDPSLLAILLVTYGAHFFLHFAVESHQPWAASGGFEFVSFAAWGLLAGMPLGRSTNVLLRYMRIENGRGSAPTLE
ncbi:hypothetical protein FAZ95_23560 [Trinickia violacea]|uniref:DUF1453 domain-containing protein n=1 Tax=Trinickia violacea TaxID=2571746 RepID=A0A4P8IVC6_9BURK|nr:hypothetical protein [Trinickia violacea]QCP52167.1 hypothetical protein FAZ95_23560 [Trinickia violacea]